MSEEHGKSQLLLIREAATSPVLLAVIFGIASLVQLATGLMSEVESLAPVYKELELIEPILRYAELFLLVFLSIAQAFNLALGIFGVASKKYHSTATAFRAERHARRKQKLQDRLELEKLEMEHEARRRINQCLAPEHKFPLRIEADPTKAGHVVGIRSKA